MGRERVEGGQCIEGGRTRILEIVEDLVRGEGEGGGGAVH